MIRDINIDDRKIHILYADSDRLLYPNEHIYPSNNLFPTEWTEFEDNIVEGSVRLNEVIVDSQLTFGALYSSEFEVTVYNINDISGKYIQVYMEDGEYSKGIFFGKVISCKQDNTGLDRTIVAYDNAYELREVNVADWWTTFWTNKVSSTVKECRESLLATMEVPFEDIELDNDNVVIHKNVDFTYMAFATVLQMLCEINGCIPHFDMDGVMHFIVLQTEQEMKDITGLYEGLNSTFEDYTVDPITGIEFFDSDNELKYLVGSPENTYKMTSNIFLYDMGTQELEAIADVLLGYLSELTYTPANVKMIVGDLNYRLGDRIHTPKGDFYIMEQEFYSSQLIEQTMICKGEQKRGPSGRNINNDLIILNEKYAKLNFDVESFRLEFGDYQAEVSSMFEQTAEQITLEVARGTEGMHPTYQGSYVPTLNNLPASQWTTDAMKEKNIGVTFYNTAEGRTYRFTKKANAVRITFSSDSALENTYDYVEIYCYYNGAWRRSSRFTGGVNGTTNNIAGKMCIIPTNQFYVYFHSDGGTVGNGFKISSAVTCYTSNPLEYFPSTGSVPSYSQTSITGISRMPESEHPYRNNQNLVWNWNTQLSISGFGYEWQLQENYAYSRITQTADEIRLEVEARQNADTTLSSQITQTASQISMKVSKGDVSSQLSLESDQIRLSSGRLIISTGNFQIDEYGSVKIKEGELTLGGSGDGEITMEDRWGDTIGYWNRTGFYLYDDDDNVVFRVDNEGEVKLKLSGDHDLELKMYDDNAVIMFDNDAYIDGTGAGASGGMHFNADKVVFSVDEIGVTDYRGSTGISYGESGTYHYRDEYGDEHIFHFINGLLVDWD